MNKIAAPLALSIIVLFTTATVWAGTPASRIRIEALPRLIALVMKDGDNVVFPPNFAKAVGIPAGLTTKNLSVGDHVCTVLYAPEKTSSGATGQSKKLYLYLRIHKQTPHSLQVAYYKTDLQGRLEMAFYLSGKYDDKGKPYGASDSYPDVHSPEVKRAFEKEMIFWLNDWLPKQGSAHKG